MFGQGLSGVPLGRKTERVYCEGSSLVALPPPWPSRCRFSSIVGAAVSSSRLGLIFSFTFAAVFELLGIPVLYAMNRNPCLGLLRGSFAPCLQQVNK